MHNDIFAEDPTRLIDAADAVAEALSEVADAETRPECRAGRAGVTAP